MAEMLLNEAKTLLERVKTEAAHALQEATDGCKNQINDFKIAALETLSELVGTNSPNCRKNIEELSKESKNTLSFLEKETCKLLNKTVVETRENIEILHKQVKEIMAKTSKNIEELLADFLKFLEAVLKDCIITIKQFTQDVQDEIVKECKNALRSLVAVK